MNLLMSEKTDLIDYACRNFRLKSFADLGAVWVVNGGYTFYTLENYKIDKAFLVDTDTSSVVEEKQKSFPQLSVIKANFGSHDIAKKIGDVDAIFMFDVLLHQVSPDWDEVIRIYSSITRNFIVYNPQYIGPKTLRLLALGEEEYFNNVPHSKTEEPYKSLFEKMYEIHPQHQRIYRDIHNVWQWGIVTDDLIDVMRENGFQKMYHRNYGQWNNLQAFERHAFIFTKSELPRPKGGASEP